MTERGQYVWLLLLFLQNTRRHLPQLQSKNELPNGMPWQQRPVNYHDVGFIYNSSPLMRQRVCERFR